MKRGVEMYFITTLRICGNIVDDCRTIGMKNSYAGCYYDIASNACDMFEDGYYQYAFISFIDEGLYPNVTEQQWFKFIREEKNGITGVAICDRPAEIGDYKPYIIG